MMVIQVEVMKAFLAQFVGSSGKGLSTSTCNRNDSYTKFHVAKAYSTELVDKSTRQKVREQKMILRCLYQVVVLGTGLQRSLKVHLLQINQGKKGKKHIGILMLVWRDNCKRQNVFWLKIKMMICLLNVHLHVAKTHLLKITMKLFSFLAWV